MFDNLHWRQVSSRISPSHEHGLLLYFGLVAELLDGRAAFQVADDLLPLGEEPHL